MSNFYNVVLMLGILASALSPMFVYWGRPDLWAVALICGAASFFPSTSSDGNPLRAVMVASAVALLFSLPGAALVTALLLLGL